MCSLGCLMHYDWELELGFSQIRVLTGPIHDSVEDSFLWISVYWESGGGGGDNGAYILGFYKNLQEID